MCGEDMELRWASWGVEQGAAFSKLGCHAVATPMPCYSCAHIVRPLAPGCDALAPLASGRLAFAGSRLAGHTPNRAKWKCFLMSAAD
jgi:hypothetical protein